MEKLAKPLKKAVETLGLAKCFAELCDAYARKLSEQWDCGDYWFWIGDDYGTLAMGDSFYLSIEDVRYIVEHEIAQDTVEEWTEYNLQIDYGIELGEPNPHINLQSWCNGFPDRLKVPKEKLADFENRFFSIQGNV